MIATVLVILSRITPMIILLASARMHLRMIITTYYYDEVPAKENELTRTRCCNDNDDARTRIRLAKGFMIMEQAAATTITLDNGLIGINGRCDGKQY